MAEESNDKKSRVDWWAIATGAWIAVVLGVGIAKRFWTMELNSMGDYVAGAFAPPALIWLVRGYYQQGKALQVQISELRQSVAEFSRQTELMEQASQSQLSDQRYREFKQHVELIPIRLLPVLEAFHKLNSVSGIGDILHNGFLWRGLTSNSDATEYKQVVNSIAKSVNEFEAQGGNLDSHLRKVDGELAGALRIECLQLRRFAQEGWKVAGERHYDEWVAQGRLFGLFDLCNLSQTRFTDTKA